MIVKLVAVVVLSVVLTQTGIGEWIITHIPDMLYWLGLSAMVISFIAVPIIYIHKWTQKGE